MKYNIDLRKAILWVGLLCMCACNEDKGNYDYDVINRVTEIKDIKEEYAVEVGERLQISPKLDTTLGNTDDLAYAWYYKNDSEWNVLQEGNKDLDFIIADPIGAPNKIYTCAFEAKNKVTDVAYRQVFSVRVSGTFNRGYVLLYEKEDEFDMGMIVLNSQNQYLPKYNILASTAPSLQREGVKPYGLNIYADPTAPHPYEPDGSERSVYLLTDHYMTRLKVADFSWDPSYDVSNSVENGSPLYQNYVSAGKPIIAEKMKVSYFVTGNKLKPHVYMYVKDDDGKGNWYLHNTYPVNYFFSYPMNAYRVGSSIYNSIRYEPSPFLSCGNRITLFYNLEKKKFSCQTTYHSSSDFSTSFFYTEDFLDESTNHIFNFNADNDGLLYMGERYTELGKMTSFAFLKQSDGTFKFIEYYLPSTKAALVTKDNKLRACTFDASTGIDRAKFIAAAPEPNNAFIYYATDDNRVFYADVSGGSAVVREITDEVTPDGYDEITSLKFMIPSTSSKYLGIATYNSSLGKEEGGRIDFYSMPNASSGGLSIATHKVNDNETIKMSWKGFGKVVDMDYKP